MLEEIRPTAFETAIREMFDSSQLLRKVYFFHDIRVICQTNHPTILSILDEMLGIFASPEQGSISPPGCSPTLHDDTGRQPIVGGTSGQVRGTLHYYVLCYESAADFPLRLPHTRRRVDTVRLLTNTQLKHYVSMDDTTEYQSYKELHPINGTVLSVMNRLEPVAFTQIETPEAYARTFLRRYVFLLALGQVLGQFGFEPCHAAAICAPWDSRQGALIIGASGSGKTTLSLSCASAGFGLLGDDLVMLRESAVDSNIEAWAITHEVSARSHTLDILKNLGPLSFGAIGDGPTQDAINLVPTSTPQGTESQNLSFLDFYPVDHRDKRYFTIEQVRAGATRFQTPIRLLLFPSLTEEGASRVRRLSKADTLRKLIDLCMSTGNNHAYSQEKLFHLLSQMAEQAPGYQLEIARETNDGPELIRSLFAGESYD